jgi:hypothetical protein
MFIENYLRDLSIASARKVEVKKSSAQPKLKWIMSSHGYAKMNVDAAVDL